MVPHKALVILLAVVVALPALPPPAGASHSPAAIGVVPRFTNVTMLTGLGAPLTALPPDDAQAEDNAAFLNGGKGAAWFDYDKDGWEDLLIAGYHRRELHRNNGDGTFTDRTAAAGLQGTMYTMGTITPDFNNDGYPDVVFANWYGRSEIFLNTGNGSFRNVTQAWNFFFNGPAAGMAFGDLDGDGWGDLYVGAYHRRSNGLFRNLAGQGLEDITKKAGVQDLDGYTFQVLMFDYDLDGDLDLFDSNDFGPDALFRNEGNFTFTDVSTSAGVGIKGDGMGAAIGDLNDDGYMDIYVTNFGPDYWLVYDPTNGTYVETHAAANITNIYVGWGCQIQDFNNDGFVDVFIANGRVIIGQSPEPDMLWINHGNGTFFEAAAEAGVQDYGINRGSAAADYNRDGQLDLWVANVVANSSAYRNEGTANHWLQVELAGVVSIRDAVGARVTVEAGGRSQTRAVHLGASYLSQDSLVQHFGLGAVSTVARVTIDWPSGVRQVFTNLSADQRLRVQEFEPNVPVASAPDIFRDAGLEVVFNGSASVDDTKITSWQWSFADPYAGVSLTGWNASHTFYDPANFTGTLTVADAFGNSGSTTFNLTIRPVGHPLVYAGADLEVAQNATVAFSATLKGGPSYADYLNTTFAWVINGADGTTNFSGRNVSRAFAVPGTYAVTVIATDQFGASGNDTLVLTVGDNQPPVIVFTPPAQAPEDTPFTLDASSSYDNDPTFPATGLFYWRLQGAQGQFEVRTGASPEFTLRDPGPVRFDLEVTDSTGNLAVRLFTIEALDGTPPVAEGGGDRIALAGATVTLDASSSTDNDPTFKEAGFFEWTFMGPDGPGREFGITARIVVSNPGVTHVRLHVRDPTGNPAVRDDGFNITALDRTSPVLQPMPNLEVTFGEPAHLAASAATDNDPDFERGAVYTWTIVDGSTVRTFLGASLDFSFARVGRWPVTLVVVDSAGNFAEQHLNVTVVDRTAPVLIASLPAEALVGDPVVLNAENSTDDVGIVSFVWTIEGPGILQSLNGRFLRWTFQVPGNYSVRLEVRDAAGNLAGQAFNLSVKSAEAPPLPPEPGGQPANASPGNPSQGSGLALAAVGLGGAGAVAAFMVLRRRRQAQP